MRNPGVRHRRRHRRFVFANESTGHVSIEMQLDHGERLTVEEHLHSGKTGRVKMLAALRKAIDRAEKLVAKTLYCTSPSLAK